MEMEPDVISQTALDQLVCSEQSQMLKALIPYTSSGNQQFLALYAKLMEFQNTVALFRGGQNDVQICSLKGETDPLEMLEDIRKFSYGKSRHQLDQIKDILVMIQFSGINIFEFWIHLPVFISIFVHVLPFYHL